MKSTLLIATQNAGKLAEFRALLGARFECLALNDPHWRGIVCPDVVEDGSTYFENCLKKAMTYFGKYRTPVLADDSGLEVDGLQGGPGIHSARFGGESLGWPQRWELMISHLRGQDTAAWRARFRCVLCYYDGQGVPVFFQATSEGHIVAEPKGQKGFGYDPIFFSDELGKTFAEASGPEKDRVSHRGRAVSAFLAAANS